MKEEFKNISITKPIEIQKKEILEKEYIDNVKKMCNAISMYLKELDIIPPTGIILNLPMKEYTPIIYTDVKNILENNNWYVTFLYPKTMDMDNAIVTITLTPTQIG